MTDVTLATDLSRVLGAKTAKALNTAFDMQTVADLLEHYPRRYATRGELTPLAYLPVDEQVSVVAEVKRVEVRQMQRRRGSIVEAVISDGNGELTLTWFNQPWRVNALRQGVRGMFSGRVGLYRGTRTLAHPDFELFDESTVSAEKVSEWADEIIPIYPSSARVPTWVIQASVRTVLDVLGPVDEPLPTWVLEKLAGVGAALIPFREALEMIHRPKKDIDHIMAVESMKHREAFELMAGLRYQKAKLAQQLSRSWPHVPGGLRDRFDDSLPFTLTDDQTRVSATLQAELARTQPMHRLLQGEVASGKTLVALQAMLQVADGGAQSALLAPTEVLASQHFRSVNELLGEQLLDEVRPVLLTGQMTAADRKRALLDIASGAAKIIVGTHALMSEATTFADLAFVVIDEQHRFGVEQREALRQKSSTPPHVLVMTATPIPRTVALTAFGDLEVSTIRQLPPGRPGTVTYHVSRRVLPDIQFSTWRRAAQEIEKGRQVYIVCPAISQQEVEEQVQLGLADDGHTLEVEAGVADIGPATVETIFEAVSKSQFLRGTRIASLTGAMPSAEKDAVMSAFAAGTIDVLVATTVIEVGVNVPNASMMIVLDAERFGISQLHQLRGRVGRGNQPGVCVLLSNTEPGSREFERLEAVAATNDGFELAEIDLRTRREGDMLGAAQSGSKSGLKLLRVARDGELIAKVSKVVDEVLGTDPAFERWPKLRERLDEMLDERVANLGKS